MSVAGFDIGSQTCTVAVARKRGIDVVLNKESNRETPAIVSFTTKDRQMGTDAVGSLTVNPKNTISQIKRLIGKNFNSPAVQRDIARYPFKVVEAPDGGCLVEVEYLEETRQFSPVQLMAMVLFDNRQVALADGSPVTDCVVTVPVFYAEAERYAMLAATQVAGLSCLRLMNDNTATALAYGIYKTDLPEVDPVTVVFVDLGHTAMQISVVSFKKGQLQVLSHAWDRDLGGRDFDEALFDYWCKEFDTKFKLNVRSSPRASFRLRLACEKLKKVLSANAEATIHVECLMNDVDVSGSMTREVFEELIQPLIDRIKITCAKAVEDAGVTVEQISTVEVVGGSSRVPAATTALADYFGKEPSRTMNAKECVSRGAALQCAMLSPIFRVRDFEVIDKVALGVEFSWEKDGQPTSSVVFERNSPVPSVKLLTFFRDNEFTLVGRYTDDSDIAVGEPREIGKWVVGSPNVAPAGGEQAKIKVKARLNLHGLVTLEGAHQLVEEDVEEAPKGADTPMQDADTAEAKVSATEGPSDGGAAAAEAAAEAADTDADGSAAAPMETEGQPALAKKKRSRKVALTVTASLSSVPEAKVQVYHEQEAELALQDRIQAETADRKNELEAYVYSLRSKLADQLSAYAPAKAREALTQRLNDMENWLYEEGEDEKKTVYIEKLDELRKQGDPIVARAAEELTRGPAASSLTTAASRYATSATSDDPKLAHIAPADKQKIVEECQSALAWLKAKKDLQARLGKVEDPVLLTADIKKKEDTLHRVAVPILSRPAPPPPKEEPKKEDAKPAEAAATEGDAKVASEVEIEEMDAEGGEAVPATEDVPMQS